ncbi:MAG: HAMP domain-containing protein, partial [Candidatus Riflebacteria bacterium]|nr:HAMP domain-containing protein [Candidatus Riflebacteria bacterium]
MKDKLSNLLLILLLLLPLQALKSGWHEISSIFVRWQAQDQERFAAQKLGEVAANMDLSQQLAQYALLFREGMTSLLLEYPDKKPGSLHFGDLAESVFVNPFPDNEVWSFAQRPNQSESEMVFTSEKSVSRRPMEMVFQALVVENQEKKQSQGEIRRNEKLLQKIFGNGCTIQLLACDQRGIATPVIYRKIPSFLLWDYSQAPDGTICGFFLIIPRNQDLDAAVMGMAAKKTGLGKDVAGGFVRIFDDGSPDQIFPEHIAGSKIFRSWRNQLGTVRENLEKWETEGFPWALPCGNSMLYTRILTGERHLAILLLPAGSSAERPLWLQLINLFGLAAILMLTLRGLILGIWPFKSINSRFAVVFLLAATLPVALFVTSATAYCFERFKADENHLEETLATSLSDFDAGKESLENAYMSAFSAIKSDSEVTQALEKQGMDASPAVFEKIRRIAGDRPENISISGFALFDLGGNLSIDCRGNIRKSDFETLARFYGLPFTLNLRRAVALDEPDFELPFHKIDQNNLAAIQSFKRNNEGIEYELARYKNRVVRTDFGRGFLGYIYDFITINGKNRYVLMVAWLESDIDRTVIQRSADQLGVKAPQIKLAAFKRTPNGEESLLRIDRSFSTEQLKACRRVSDSAFSIKSGILKASAAGMSVVAYASKHFDRTVLVGAIDHEQKNSEHQTRVVIFVFLGLLAGTMLVASALVIWVRIARPLKEIKSAFDIVEGGQLVRLSAIGRSDEIGMLNDEFNNMIKGLEERHRLASMLSEHAVAAVVCTSSDKKAPTEKFSAVVMVSDIRSFTTICEQQPARQ